MVGQRQARASSPTATSASSSTSAAIIVAGKRIALPADDDRRLTDSRWHHIAVTYDGEHGRRLPRRRAARQRRAVDAQHRRRPASCSAPASRPARPSPTTSSPSTRARSTPRRSPRTSPPRATPPPRRPAALQADARRQPRRGHAGAAPRRRARGPAAGRPLHRRGAPGRRRRGRAGGRRRRRRRDARAACPAGTYTVERPRRQRLRRGPDATVDATVAGTARPTPATVAADAPELYWRLGEKSGDARRRRLRARPRRALRLARPNERTRSGALPSDRDGAVADGRVWYWQRVRPDPRAARHRPARRRGRPHGRGVGVVGQRRARA